MLEGLQNFVVRHRRKFIVTSCIIGGVYVSLSYAKKYLINYHEGKAREFLENQRRLQHFDSTEATCNKVIIGMGGELFQFIINECNTENILARIRENPANKVELWNDVKIKVFTRLTTFVYASSMLIVVLRIQLNLLGGYLYQDATKQQQQKINDELKQNYLSLIRHFMQKGIKDLVDNLHEKCEEVLKEYSLIDKLNLIDIEKIFTKLHKTIMNDGVNDPSANMSKYLMPAKLEINSNIGAINFPCFQQMYAETLDLLESDDAINICNTNINRGFSVTLDAMAEYWNENITDSAKIEAVKNYHQNNDIDNNVDDGDRIVMGSSNNNDKINFNLSEIKIPLAKVMPIINELTTEGLSTVPGKETLATSLIAYCMVMEKAKTLGANIYETFSTSQL